MNLLKKLSAGAFLLFFINGAFAQDNTNYDSQTNFGIKGGLNYSTVSRGKFSEGPDPRTSFNIGFFGEIPISKNIFSIQPEILYSRQGFQTNESSLGSSNYKTIYKIDYLNFPILAKIYLGKAFSLEVGPQFGLKVNESIETENSTSTDNVVNNFDTAIALGFSFNFDGGAFISGRFTQSFNEVIQDSNSKNMVFQLGLGFKM